MSTSFLMAVLAFCTMFAVATFAYVSAQKTKKSRDSDTPKSTLAADAPDTR